MTNDVNLYVKRDALMRQVPAAEETEYITREEQEEMLLHAFTEMYRAQKVEVQHCLAVWWPRSDTCGIMNPCPRPVGVPAPFGVCVVYPPSYGLVYMCIVRRVAMPVPRHISRPSPCFFIPFPLAFPVPIRYICPHRRDEPPHFLFY